jgi:hypothetical protein
MTNYCGKNPPKYDTNIKRKKENKTSSSLVEFKHGLSIIGNQYVVMLQFGCSAVLDGKLCTP